MSLRIDNLSLTRSGTPYLADIAFTIERGTLTVVIGRTLAGKTTLLRVLAGLEGADQGRILLDGRPFSTLPAWRRDVAMVYQQFINYPHLSVFDNVAFPLRRRGMADAEVRRRVPDFLEKVGLAGFGERRPSQLSGGQQQRVAVARALARESPILLLDEPLVNLDYKLREQLRLEFRGLLSSRSDGIVIYSTTEPAEAMMLGDRVIVMHEGRILQNGTPAEIFDRPASVTVAAIVNDPPMSTVAGRIETDAVHLGSGLTLPMPPHMRGLPPGTYRFGMRASDLWLTSDGGLPGTLDFSEVSGSETFFYIETPAGPVTVQSEGVERVALGTPLSVAVPAERLFAFSPSGELAAAP